MLGAIIGDVVGSPYAFESDKIKDFPLFTAACTPTDDSILTIAVGCACVSADCRDEFEFKRVLCERLKEFARQYPEAGYGYDFYQWMLEDDVQPYGSYGNGSAMRVSPVAWAAHTLEDVECLAKWSAEVTHNHPDGIKGAQAVAAAIFLARTGADKETIRSYVEAQYYDLNFTVEDIRAAYTFDVTCEGSVPQAIVCFLDSVDFEDAIRNAVSLGGDGDTLACIAGSIAEAYYGIPDTLQDMVFAYIDDHLQACYWEYAEILYG